MDTNVLYYGDNLDILRRYVPDESVDLVYLDPPFNSQRVWEGKSQSAGPGEAPWVSWILSRLVSRDG
jgi:16S rRNA G966 N2-methylase RsmD